MSLSKRVASSFMFVRRPGIAALVYIVLSIVLLSSHWALGPYPISLFPSDTLHVLVQGDYLLRGLAPYEDYSSTHGVLPYIFSAIGLTLFGVSLKATLFTQISLAALLGALVFLAALRRLSGWWSVLIAISATLLLVSATPLGYKPWREFSVAMIYNAMGFVMLCGLTILVTLPPPRPTRILGRFLDIGVQGTLLAGLFLTKITFFCAGIGVFLSAGVLWASWRQRVNSIGSLLLAAAMSAGVLRVCGTSSVEYLGFIMAIPTAVSPASLSFRFIYYNRTLFLVIVALFALGYAAHATGGMRGHYRPLVLGIVALAAILVATSTCCQEQEVMPFVGIAPLVLAVSLVRSRADRLCDNVGPLLVTAALVIFFLLVIDAKNALLSVGFSRMRVPTLSIAARRSNATRLTDLRHCGLRNGVDPRLFELLPAEFVDSKIKEPLALLHDAGARPGDVLFVCTTADVTTLFTGLEYPLGGAPWWQYFVCPRPEDYPLLRKDFLVDTDWILRFLPKDACWRYAMHHRGKYINTHFRPVSRSEHWELFARAKVASMDHRSEGRVAKPGAPATGVNHLD